MQIRVSLLILLLSIWPYPVRAQDWSVDARKVALGGVGGSGNLGAEMFDEQQRYRSIVLPFGLIQLLRDISVFDPGSERFDPVRAVEYAASPLHYIVGRDGSDSGRAFVTGVRNASLVRDLNAYQGFTPANEQRAEGRASPNWGGIIKARTGAGFHGLYIGAGPYLTMQSTAAIDPRLTTLLGSDVPVFVPNSQFLIRDASQVQLALALTGGYRARLASPGGAGAGAAANGLQLAVNYNYLHGLRYEDIGLQLRLDTDAAGFLALVPSGFPLVVDRRTAGSGRGFAIDVGVGAVVSRWAIGLAVEGIANRLHWTGVEQSAFSLPSLLSGSGEFVESPRVAVGDVRVELPVSSRGYAAYSGPSWLALAEIANGFGGGSFRGGLELRAGAVEVRGGARYTREQWTPTAGIGLRIGRRAALDVAAFGTSANIERERRLALAASIRIRREPAVPGIGF